MATSRRSQSSGSGRSASKAAGRPMTAQKRAGRAKAKPSPEELDARDERLTSARKPMGPPLADSAEASKRRPSGSARVAPTDPTGRPTTSRKKATAKRTKKVAKKQPRKRGR